MKRTILFILLLLNGFAFGQCLITNFNVTIGTTAACSEVYSSSGTVEFENPPTTGYLIIKDCDGNADTILPPFVSPVSWEIHNQDADNGSCYLESFFTEDLGCSAGPSNYIAPLAQGEDETGTFTTSFNGHSTNAPVNGVDKFILCDGDEFSFLSNGDYNLIDISGITSNPQDIYNPQMMYMFYACNPYNFGPGTVLTDDTCLVGIQGGSDEISLINMGGNSDSYLNWFNNNIYNNVGLVDNTFFIVPLGAYSFGSPYIFINTNCHDFSIEDIVEIQYLNPIDAQIEQYCDSAIITLSGGYPEFYPSTEFTASNLSAGVFENSTCGQNEIIKITGLQQGELVTFDVVDENGCPISFSFGLNAGADSTFVLCENDSASLNLTDFVTGDAGGLWDSELDLAIFDSITANLDVTNLVGDYNFYYLVGNACEVDTAFISISIGNYPNLVAGSDIAVCENEMVNLVATGADTYQWNNGVVNGEVFTASETDYYVVTGSLDNGCSETDSLFIDVTPLPNAGLDTTIIVCFETLDSLVLINFLPDAHLSGHWNDLDISTQFNPFTSKLNLNNLTGIFHFRYVVPTSLCGNDTSLVTVQIENPQVDPGNYPNICEGDSLIFSANSFPMMSYTWNNGVEDGVIYTPLESNYYTVVAEDQFGCTASDSVYIELIDQPLVSFTSSGNIVCEGDSVIFTYTGEVCLSYSWDFGNGTSAFGEMVTGHFSTVDCYDITLTQETDMCQFETIYEDFVCVESAPVISLTDTIVLPNVLTILLNNELTSSILGEWQPYSFIGLGEFDENTSELNASGATPGYYTFIYAVDVPCGIFYDSIVVQITDGLSIDKVKVDLIEVYPNPSEGIFTISGVPYTELRILDLSGKELSFKQNGNEIVVSDLSKGTYILELTLENNQIARKRFVKK